jgi:hypothetical protein
LGEGASVGGENKLNELLDSVDLVCERTDDGIWAEPLNAISSLAYFAVPIIVGFIAKDHVKQDRSFAGLLVLMFLVGVASFSDHTLSIYLAHLFNEAATIVFIVAYVVYACRRLLEIDWIPTVIVVLSLSGLGILFSAWSHGIGTGGIGGYIPIWVFLSYLAWALRGSQTLRYFLAGSAAFAVALAFRASDFAVCPYFPAGTHFLWHLSNDIVLFCLLMAIVRFRTGTKPGTI